MAGQAISVVTDVGSFSRCLKSLNDIKQQCALDPSTAALHHADYAAATQTIVRGCQVALESADGSTAVQLLSVVTGACQTAHALSRLPIDLSGKDLRGRAALRREMSLLTALLHVMPCLPPAAMVTIRLTAKSIARSRAVVIAADPASCAVWWEWLVSVLASPSRDPDDVNIAMLALDRLGREASPTQTPPSVLEAAQAWRSRCEVNEAAVEPLNKLIVEDFLRRHATVVVIPAIKLAEAGESPIAATPRRPMTPRPGALARHNPRPEHFEDRVDAVELVRQLLDGHGWTAGCVLNADDATSVLAAAKEYLETELVAAATAAAKAHERLQADETQLAAAYSRLQQFEATSAAPGPTADEFRHEFERVERALRKTSAATPRLGVPEKT